MSSVLETVYNITFNVQRVPTATGSMPRTEETVVSGADGVFRPVTDIADLFDRTRYGKEFRLFTSSDVDIRTNDVVVIDSKRYGVAGVSNYEDLEDDTESHIEARIYNKT